MQRSFWQKYKSKIIAIFIVGIGSILWEILKELFIGDFLQYVRKQTGFFANILVYLVDKPLIIIGLAFICIVIWAYLDDKKRSKQPSSRLLIPILPPRFEQPFPVAIWVGREDKIEQLNAWIRNESGPAICCIEGFLGVGKSSLAWAWLQHHIIPKQKELGLEAVFQWSFSKGQKSFGDFLLSLCRYLEVNISENDLVSAIIDILAKRRILLVLDGFESLLWAYSTIKRNMPPKEMGGERSITNRSCVDLSVARWLGMLSTLTGTRILITSQLLPAELDEKPCIRIVLNGLEPHEAVIYLRKRGIKGNQYELQNAAQFYGCHPLMLERLTNVLHYDLIRPDDIGRFSSYRKLIEYEDQSAEQHILESALKTLEPNIQQFLAKISAGRDEIPMNIAQILANGISHTTFVVWLQRLENDHWLTWDREKNALSLHPIVRHLAYTHLENKTIVHEQFRQYFISCVKEIQPIDPGFLIQIYYHTVRSGQTDEAAKVFFNELYGRIRYRLGMNNTIIELLNELFSENDSDIPQLSDKYLQFRTLDALAYTYRLVGQGERVLECYRVLVKLAETQGLTSEVSFGLRNILRQHVLSGEIGQAYEINQRHIKLADEGDQKSLRALSHRDLGLLKSISGDYDGAKEELNAAERIFIGLDDKRRIGMVYSYRARLSNWVGDANTGLVDARKAYELACIEQQPRDLIWAQWQMGCAYRLTSDINKSETCLQSALQLCRDGGMVDLEPEILIETARLILQIIKANPGKIRNPKQYVDDALSIISRCGYRLFRADASNTYARIALEQGDLATALRRAREAKEFASCGSYVYRFAADEAYDILGNP